MSNIRQFCRLSCATGDGIDDLKNAIQQTLPHIELLSTPFPATWFNVKTVIAEQAKAKNYTSYDHYLDLCHAQGITKECEQQTLISFLHDLGLVIHFQQKLLRETNVINPKWLTEAVYTLINAPQLANNGQLKSAQLPQLLETTLYSSHKHDYIIEFLKKFELCYAVDEQTLLIPDLFPVQEPPFEFDDDNALHFILQYDFLPKSIFIRFVVRMYHDIQANLYWRTGVILQDNTYNTTYCSKPITTKNA
jgi:hypothetical protein